MKRKRLIYLSTIGGLLIFATLVIAGPPGIMGLPQRPRIHPFADLDLTFEQTERIRDLRMVYEATIGPLKALEHQKKAEFNLLWLQIESDPDKLRTAQKATHDIKFQILEKTTEFQLGMRKLFTEKQLSKFLALSGDWHHYPGDFRHHPPHPKKEHFLN